MPISQKPTENIPKDIWNVYQILMEIAFGNEDASKASKFYTKDAFMIGTAEKELVIGHQALINFFDSQQKSSAEVNLKYRRFPVKSWSPTKSTFCITDQYDMILEDEVAFRMRLTCVFVQQDKKWLCDHVHSSVPDRNVPEDEFWPIEELKRQNQILAKKVKGRTRELEIEAATEKVRAQAMGMVKTEDILDVLTTFRSCLENLGLESIASVILIANEDRTITQWDVTEMESGKKELFHITMDLEKAPMIRKMYKTASKQSYSVLHVPNKDLKVFASELKTFDERNGEIFSQAIKDGVITEFYTALRRFSYGFLELDFNKKPTQEIEIISSKMAIAFEQAFVRFQDLQKAEAQAREAQVEAAVERVRAQAMAMHQPDDIVKVNETMLKEIADLGIKNLTGAAIILFDKNDILTMWDISDPGNMGNVRDNKSIYDPRDFAVLGDFWRRWKKGENYFVIEYDFQTVNTALEEWKKVDYENYLSLKRAIDEDKLKTQWNPFASFSRGLLTLDLMEEPNADTEKIMTKMANTFDLAYQRFDDLQKAAEQAQEARKQASLDRIRAEIASMRNQKDLEKLTPFIWMELSTMGISFFRCGIFIMDEQSRKINMYLSTPMGESIATVSLGFDNSPITKAASEHWKAQQIFREKWNKEQFIEWSEGLVSQGLVISAKSYQHADNPPDKLCLQFVPFKQGMLYVGTADFLIENDLELIKDVADTFSIAYTRYEDFVQLERAKHMAEDALGELRSTQSQLIHAEKMASLGELTAGIAHEIQNPLNFVNNFSDLNKELVDELHEAIQTGNLEEAKAILQDLQSNEDKIIHHGKRAEGIVKGMLQHSRSGDGKKELTDLNQLADEFLRLSYHGLRAKDKSFNAEFTSSLDKNIPKVSVIPQDIGRVLLNLINNAFHATNEKKAADPSYKPVVEVITHKEDDHVTIIVKDNGPGIPDKIKEKIFQPFFTTKATGTGTGLGLSMSHDIISKGHGGTIEVESEAGEGTTFTIRLPFNAS